MIALLSKNWKIGVIALALGIVFFLGGVSARKEAVRLELNLANITKSLNRELTLTHKEYKQINTPAKTKIDSTAKKNSINTNSIASAQNISTSYKDTAKTPVTHGQPLPVESLKPIKVQQVTIPVEVVNTCWGMRGYILTTDPDSRLFITEKTANNSIQLLVVRKRFLGFLWYTKKTEFKAFSDCGQLDVTKITFVK